MLLALHVAPDPDCAASVLAMDLFLRRLGKKTKIISYSPIPPDLCTLSGLEKVEILDFGKVDFHRFDLFIALDSFSQKMITRGSFPRRFPNGFRIINIDHHLANSRFGHYNYVAKASATAELIYDLFNLWKVKIDKALAEILLAGIVSDSGCFQIAGTQAKTLRTCADLTDKGAVLFDNVVNYFRSYSLKTLKYWSRILDNMRLDDSGLFVWSVFSQADKEELAIQPVDIKEAASLFAPVVKGTEFGIILNEETETLTRGSLRARTDFDVSRIAVELGGGGHKGAAGFSLNLPLEEAEKKVLETVRKYIKN